MLSSRDADRANPYARIDSATVPDALLTGGRIGLVLARREPL